MAGAYRRPGSSKTETQHGAADMKCFPIVFVCGKRIGFYRCFFNPLRRRFAKLMVYENHKDRTFARQ